MHKAISKFLKEHIATLPNKGRGEVGRIAEHLRVSSSLVSKVISGEKSFTLEQAQSLTEYLGLLASESEYCIYLVNHERAGSKALRDFWAKKMSDLRAQASTVTGRVQVDKELTEEERAVFYSSPLYSAIRLYTSTADEGRSLTEICERFSIDPKRAARILEFLTQHGFCHEQRGFFTRGLQKTHIEAGSPHAIKHHSNWRIRAIQAAEDLSEEEMMYTGLVSISREDFKFLREEMVSFITEALKRVHDSPAEDVAFINLDFIWVRK